MVGPTLKAQIELECQEQPVWLRWMRVGMAYSFADAMLAERTKGGAA